MCSYYYVLLIFLPLGRGVRDRKKLRTFFPKPYMDVLARRSRTPLPRGRKIKSATSAMPPSLPCSPSFCLPSIDPMQCVATVSHLPGSPHHPSVPLPRNTKMNLYSCPTILRPPALRPAPPCNDSARRGPA